MRRSKLLLGAEAGISHAALNQAFHEGLVDLSSLALAIRAVGTVVALERRALVKRQAERGKRLDDGLHTALNLALLVSILNAQVKHAARLMRQALVDQRAVQIAEVHKAGRARAHAGHLGGLGQGALRVARLDLLRCGMDMRQQQLRKMLVIHFVHSNFQIRAFSPMIEIFYHSAARGARQKPHQSPYIAPPDFRQTPPSTAKRHGFFCHAA